MRCGLQRGSTGVAQQGQRRLPATRPPCAAVRGAAQPRPGRRRAAPVLAAALPLLAGLWPRAAPRPAPVVAQKKTTMPLSEVVSDAVERWFEDTLYEVQHGGSSEQASLLAQMFAEGYGCPRDPAAAARWAQRAAERGARELHGVYDDD